MTKDFTEAEVVDMVKAALKRGVFPGKLEEDLLAAARDNGSFYVCIMTRLEPEMVDALAEETPHD